MNTEELSQDERAAVNALADAVQIGQEAEGFLATPLGQWIIAKARQERAKIIEQLILTDPTDAKAVADLQGKAVLLSLFKEWLDQAICEGTEATQFFKQYDD